MTKSELISSIAERVKMTKSDVESVVSGLITVVTESLIQREEVRLMGFGIFTTRHRRGGMAHNPKTRVPVAILPSVVPVFRPGKPLKAAINGNQVVNFEEKVEG